MNKALLGFGSLIVASSATIGVTASRYEPRIRMDVFCGPLSVGGMSVEDAQKKVRLWWEQEKLQPIRFAKLPDGGTLDSTTLEYVGLSVLDQQTIARAPLDSFADNLRSSLVRPESQPMHLPILFHLNQTKASELESLIKKRSKPLQRAKAIWQDGMILTTPEISSFELDQSKLLPVLESAVGNEEEVSLPFEQVPKRVPDDKLSQIQGVISEFSTRFSAQNYPRASNIKVAASKLNGIILMPGDHLSFNTTVGRRTLRAGFQFAGVYINGQHDTGIGGGICQVSTTLYNASLLGGLKVIHRFNHSLPVPYVPLGRDATVDFGNLDLEVQNVDDSPVAITSEYQPGKLTFRLLGLPRPGVSVKIFSKPVLVKPVKVIRTRTVFDAKVPAGQVKVVDSGLKRRIVSTFRQTYKDGRLVSQEELGRSFYGSGERIILVGPKLKTLRSPLSGSLSDVSKAIQPVRESESN